MASQAPAKRNSRTTQVVSAARAYYYNQVRELDSDFSDVLGGTSPGFADAFAKAKLQSEKANEQFTAPDIKAQLKQIPGITDAELKLDQVGVDALPETNAKEKQVKKALQMNLAMQAMAQEIARMQAAKLWQMQITSGELLQDDQSIGVSSSGSPISEDDLRRLSNQTEHLKVFDQTQFGSNIKVEREDGGRRFTFKGKPSKAEVAAVVDIMAQSGGTQVTVDCKSAKELDTYKTIVSTSFAHVFNAGLDMRVKANKPHFVASPLSPNSRGEPSDPRSKGAFHNGRKLHDFYAALDAAMPSGAAIASNPPLRMAQTYKNLGDVQHRRSFLKLAMRDMKDNFQAMVAEVAKTGDMKLMQSLYDDVQAVRGTEDWKIEKIYHDVMGNKPEAKEANRLVLNAYGRKPGALDGMSGAQTCKMLDNLFDSTNASRAQFKVNFERGLKPAVIINQAVKNLSDKQLQSYAKHIAGMSETMQPSERAGMVMASIKDPQRRKAFMKAYLEERHQLHMADKKFDPNTFPAGVDDYTRDYTAVLDDVRGDAADVLRGTRVFCVRSGQPNAAPLQDTLATIEDGYRDLVEGVSKDIQSHYVADFTAADGQQFVDQTCDAMVYEAPIKNFATQQEEFAHGHKPDPLVRASM